MTGEVQAAGPVSLIFFFYLSADRRWDGVGTLGCRAAELMEGGRGERERLRESLSWRTGGLAGLPHSKLPPAARRFVVLKMCCQDSRCKKKLPDSRISAVCGRDGWTLVGIVLFRESVAARIRPH